MWGITAQVVKMDLDFTTLCTVRWLIHNNINVLVDYILYRDSASAHECRKTNV